MTALQATLESQPSHTPPMLSLIILLGTADERLASGQARPTRAAPRTRTRPKAAAEMRGHSGHTKPFLD